MQLKLSSQGFPATRARTGVSAQLPGSRSINRGEGEQTGRDPASVRSIVCTFNIFADPKKKDQGEQRWGITRGRAKVDHMPV
jgi:hypothetical protein